MQTTMPFLFFFFCKTCLQTHHSTPTFFIFVARYEILRTEKNLKCLSLTHTAPVFILVTVMYPVIRVPQIRPPVGSQGDVNHLIIK